jgi:hypothetical protein
MLIVRGKTMKLKKITTLALMVTFFVFCPLLFAEQINLEKGAITFDVPTGFTSLTAKEIQIKFPPTNPPRFVVGNKDRTVTIACGLPNPGMPPGTLVDADLPGAQKEFYQAFGSRVPGIKWIKNEITDINGKKWIFLEFTSNAIDRDIHNMMLVTIFRGRALVVNFNSSKSEFQKVGAELKGCIQTLIVKN